MTVSNQPDLDELLAREAGAIAATRSALADELPRQETLVSAWDDVWLLRYVLSYKEEDKRVGAIRACMAWREEHAASLALSRSGGATQKDAIIRRAICANIHACSELGEPLVITRAGLCTPSGIFDDVTPDELVAWILFQRELVFVMCDTASRARRKLVKARFVSLF
jgi:hypothetical protein